MLLVGSEHTTAVLFEICSRAGHLKVIERCCKTERIRHLETAASADAAEQLEKPQQPSSSWRNFLQ
jgi:hypothetical protein